MADDIPVVLDIVRQPMRDHGPNFEAASCSAKLATILANPMYQAVNAPAQESGGGDQCTLAQ